MPTIATNEFFYSSYKILQKNVFLTCISNQLSFNETAMFVIIFWSITFKTPIQRADFNAKRLCLAYVKARTLIHILKGKSKLSFNLSYVFNVMNAFLQVLKILICIAA